MYYNQNKMIELFLEYADVCESEEKRASKNLKKAQRLINLNELNQINSIRKKHNQDNLDFKIDFDNYCSQIVVNDGNIYYETLEKVVMNPNYTIKTIYNLFEDGLYVKKILINNWNEELCYKTFFNDFVIDKVVNKLDNHCIKILKLLKSKKN